MGDELATAIGADPLAGIIPIAKREAEKSAEETSKKQKSAEAEFLAQEAKYTKPAPDFKPTEESASGFAAIGALLASAGAILGSNGRSSGLMAMNAVSGMMNGYNAGRKDLYEQQRQQFEMSMKSWEKHREQVKDLFAQAAKLAPYNLTKAQQYLNDGLKSLGMEPLAQVNQRSGPMAAISTFNRTDQNITGVLGKAQVATSGLLASVPEDQRGIYQQMLNSKNPKDVTAALTGLEEIRKSQIAAKKEEQENVFKAAETRLKLAQASETEMKAKPDYLSPTDARDKKEAEALAANPKMIQTAEERDKVIKWTGQVFPVEEKTKSDEFKGQRKFVAKIIGDEVNDLGSKELPKVSSTIEAVRQTNELADAVSKNPQAAGIVGNTIKFFDRYLPGRYQGTEEADPSRLAALASSDEETFKGIPKDQISEARKIQKMVVDVINARALAASGGGRMLISEFNAQKNVLGLGELSAKSAIDVYRGLADRDARSLRQYGLSDNAIKLVIAKSGGIIDVNSEDEATTYPEGTKVRLNGELFTVEK